MMTGENSTYQLTKNLILYLFSFPSIFSPFLFAYHNHHTNTTYTATVTAICGSKAGASGGKSKICK